MKEKIKDLLIGLLLTQTAGAQDILEDEVELAISLYEDIYSKNSVKDTIIDTKRFIWEPFIDDYNCDNKYWYKFQERYKKELNRVL